MKFSLIVVLIFLKSFLFSQSDLNVINSFGKSNTIVFVNELGDDYLFGYRQYSAPKIDRLFVVDKYGQIKNWIDIEIDGFTNFFFLEDIKIKDESYLLVSGKTINGDRKLLSIRYENDNFKVIDSYNVGNIPYGIILYDTYIFDKENRYMRFSYSKNGSISNEILQIAKDGKIQLVKKLEEIKISEISEIKKIKHSKEFIILADDGYYIYDYQFNIKSKKQCYFQDKNRINYITPKTINFNKDSSIVIIGTIATGDEKIQKVGLFNNLQLSKGILSTDSILLTDKIILPFESDTTLWYPWSKTNVKGIEYQGFLKGLYTLVNGGFKEMASNKIVIQKLEELKPSWTLELGKENALFNYAHMKFLSNDNLIIWGQVKNYYGNNILNGFYIKLSPNGEIITKTTFPLPTQTEISVFPNPVKDHIILNSDYNNKVTFTLYNNLGQKIFSKETKMDKTKIDIPIELPSGNYFYQIQDMDNGLLNSGKLILE